MIELGQHQTLEAYKTSSQGMYLRDDEGDEVLLPAKYCPADLEEGGKIRVFVFHDSQNRMVATTQEPLIELWGFAILECIDVARFGAFLDWGLDRDLLLPKREQIKPIRPGDKCLVYLYLDDDDRLTATMNVRECITYDEVDVKIGQEVDALVYERAERGYRVIINNTYGGMIYHSEVYAPINIGDTVKGYVGRIREDKLIDVNLRKFGYRKVKETVDPILVYLQEKGGFSPLNDKSDPALIREELQMSKKVFKKAIGALYKKKKIIISEEGITLVK